MSRVYALVGRHGDDGGRYLQTQWPQMRIAAWRLHCAGHHVQVWRAMQNGDLLRYDGEATRRITDYIVKARRALADATVLS
jgi:hypothetical protein